MASVASFMLSLSHASKVVEDGVKLIDSLHPDCDKRSDIIPFHCSLAPSFGTLTNEGYKLMDEKLKVMIGGTTVLMAKLLQDAQANKHPVEWEDIIAALATNNPFLEPMGDTIYRSDKLIEEHANVFKFDGSPDPAVVRKVESWFTSLINDNDVLRDTKIDIHVLGKIVAETGARVVDPLTLIYKETSTESKVMDIGILRYPDIERPYFKVYRIQLIAWSGCQRIAMYQHDSNGITGVFHCCKYKPRDSIIRDIAKETVKKAVQVADEMFANL